MSGQKYSAVRLQQERQEKLNLRQTLESLETETVALCQQLDNTKNSMSEGLQATFSKEINMAQQWLKKARSAAGHYYDYDDSEGDSELFILKTAGNRQRQLTAAGRGHLKSLQLTLTQKADAMGQALAKQLADANQQLFQQLHVLQLWCGEDSLNTWQQTLAQANNLLKTEHYGTLQTQLTDLQRELKEKGDWASAQEEKHQRRLYLLKALRQVAAELGFAELDTPQFENNDDRGSRILLSVDTYNQGRIDFYLTLEGLASFSDMNHERCPIEFGTLSQQLEAEFGVQTHFCSIEGSPEQSLRQKGEKELPDDGGRMAEA
ncbi:MAG: hypothetical protein DRR19_15040 [Candidatus Parabeggiatoa sp. nov. 1]|nr:MAG: hypothetical protein DRR19_15040 [Gammaproteobacteria bacterium]HEC84628.1 hypothetical protein [Thioploca sp.]